MRFLLNEMTLPTRNLDTAAFELRNQVWNTWKKRTKQNNNHIENEREHFPKEPQMYSRIHTLLMQSTAAE